jgi:tetratricopeptide (TPR) repeat protein
MQSLSRMRRRHCTAAGFVLLTAGLAVTAGAFTAKTVSRNLAWASRPALFRSGLQAARFNAKVFYNYANYERDMGNEPVARLCYKEAIRLWPSYVIAWNNLATVAENETEIEQLLQRALDLDPGHATSLFNLADLYRQRGEYHRAAYYLAHCLKYTRCLAGAEVMLADIRRHLPATEDKKDGRQRSMDERLWPLDTGYGYGRLPR